MARLIDPEKLERIKQATMSLIVENGYYGITIASIASKAGVSSGYLYRHYKGKDDLIATLVEETISKLKDPLEHFLDEGNSVHRVIAYYLNALVLIANDSPIQALFLCSLSHNKDFRKNIQAKSNLNPRSIFKKILDSGHSSKEIAECITVENLMLILIDVPMGFINQHLTIDSSHNSILPEDVELLYLLCIKALS